MTDASCLLTQVGDQPIAGDERSGVERKLDLVIAKLDELTRELGALKQSVYQVANRSQVKVDEKLMRVIEHLLQGDNLKHDASLHIWTNSKSSTDMNSRTPYLHLETCVKSSVTNASIASIQTVLPLCGILDQEAVEARKNLEATAPNLLMLLDYENDKDDPMQWNWINCERQGVLHAACNGCQQGVLPFFIPDGDATLKQSGKPAIVSAACPMVMEFTLTESDPFLSDGLQQVLNRLHMLLSVNCYITRAFGFAVNGMGGSFFVTIERRVVLNEPHFYKDTVHIVKIHTKYVAGLWNLLTAKAQQDLRFVLHPDVFALAATMQAISSTSNASVCDLSRLIGFTKISLLGVSSSMHVYGVYPATTDVLTKGPNCGIRASLIEPAFLVKITNEPGHSLWEHQTLENLARLFSAEKPALLHVQQSFWFNQGQLHDTVTFTPVQLQGRFPTKVELEALYITRETMFQDIYWASDGNTLATCWWNLPQGQAAPPLPATFATVVTKPSHDVEALMAGHI